ncbi:MAG: PQQ-dependent sugar dehydrogenase [Candidatus Dojkabacteria bacterium]
MQLFQKKVLPIFTSLIFTIVAVGFLSSLVNLIKFMQEKNLIEYPITYPPTGDSSKDPQVKVTEVLTGLANPWDMTFINKDFFYYTQRIGELRGHNLATGEDFLLIKPENIYVAGEAGLLSVQKDSDFEQNHYLFNCMDIQNNGVAAVNVVRWTVSDDLKQILDKKIIISDMPANQSGRHSGCRIATSLDGTVWIVTGDTAVGTFPQDPKSLGGKVLRVDRDGNGVDGNLTEPFDHRIFSYGHRNMQGIVLFPKPIDGVYGLTAEHGSAVDDEVNLLKQGNFGWDPIPGYNEELPMTDLVKFPNAISPIWTSGAPTVAISGLTILKGSRWQAWQGDVLVAVLKDMHIRLQKYDENWKLTRDDVIFTDFGRIRSVTQGLDGDLYFTTDNGIGHDKILRVTPVEN